jgi:D-xylose transport system permease protein
MTQADLTTAPRAANNKSFVELLANELRLLPVAAGLVALGIFFATQSDVFLTSRNLSNILVQSTVTGIIAMGLGFVLLVAEIDLSVAATSGVSSVLMAKLVVDVGLPIPLAIFIGVALGAAIGGLSARWLTWMRVPSFVVTLGLGLILTGLQLILLPRTGRYNLLGTGVENIARSTVGGSAAWIILLVGTALFAVANAAIVSNRRRAALETSLLSNVVLPTLVVAGVGAAAVALLNAHQGVPVPVLIFVGFLIVTSYVTTQTKFGLYLYAVGNNAEAARRAGIAVERVKIAAFVIAGAMAAFAGILAASRILGVSVSSGGGIGGGALLLESIAAAVIGGVSLFGGRGRVTGALFGALIIATVSNGLNLMGVESEIKLIVTGLLLVAAVSIDRFIEQIAGARE